MPTSASKIEEADELERLLDEWEKQKKQEEEQQKTNNETIQEEPPKFPSIQEEPKYSPLPQSMPRMEEPKNQLPPLTESDRRMITLIAEKLAEKTGKSPEMLQLILEEILNEDRQTLKVLRDYLTVARLLSSSGDVSQKVGDMTNANLLKLTGQKLAEKITSSRSDDMNELLRLVILMKILDIDEKDKKDEKQELTTYKYPLIDPNTGQPILDTNGNPVYVEYKIPANMPPMIPFMNQPMVNRRSEKEEELKKELEELRNEMRKLMEEKREQEMKAMINTLQSKLDEMEKRIEELKNYGGGGGVGQAGDLKSMVEQINTLKEVLSQLGYRVEEPSKAKEEKKEVDPIIELQRKKEEKSYELWTKHIGPALGDLIRNPDKIADMVEKLMSLFGLRSKAQYPVYPTPQPITPTSTQVPTEPPKLEDMIKKVRGGKPE